MRALDMAAAFERADYQPTMFDSVWVLLGDDLYELAGFLVLAKGGDDGPGVVAWVAGEALGKLSASPGLAQRGPDAPG